MSTPPLKEILESWVNLEWQIEEIAKEFVKENLFAWTCGNGLQSIWAVRLGDLSKIARTHVQQLKNDLYDEEHPDMLLPPVVHKNPKP